MLEWLFGSKKKKLDVNEMLKRSAEMEKYYLDKAVEYKKFAATEIDVDAMVVKFKDSIMSEHDSATINEFENICAKYYRQGIEDTLKAIRQ